MSNEKSETNNTEAPNALRRAPEPDLTPATKADVESMITKRLLAFHEALIIRKQINPVPLKHDLFPKRTSDHV